MNGTRPGADTAERSVKRSRFCPFTLFRRGTLSVKCLTELVAVRTWELLDRVEDLRVRRERLGQEVVDALHDLVPSLDAASRRRVLAVKRAVHADRPLTCDLDELRPLLPEPVAAPLWEWLDLAREETVLLAESHRALTDEVAASRQALARISRHEDFQLGLQISGQEMYREVREYAERLLRGEEPTGKPALQRKIEGTLTSFACRSALKPSPFGSFTELGLESWDRSTEGEDSRELGKDRRLRLVRTSLGLLTWMGHELRSIDGSADLVRVVINNTAEHREGYVRFFVRGADGDAERFGEERFVSLPVSKPVLAVMEAARNGRSTVREVVAQLTDRGLGPADAERLVHRLAEAGLCHLTLGLPDQSPHYATDLATRLREVGTDQAVACAGVFERIGAIEEQFCSTDPARREELLVELQDLVVSFTVICGIDAPPGDISRSLVFEDVGTRAASRAWAPHVVERHSRELELFQRLVPVLDHATVEKLGLYAFFESIYDNDQETVGVLDFYREFARLAPAALTDVMLGVGDSGAERVRALRRDLAGLMRNLLDGAGEAASLALPVESLETWVSNLPDFLIPWQSASYRMQFCTDDRPLAVVNGVTTGHGVFYSRYCDLFRAEANGWDLTTALREHIHRTHPRQADLTAVLGMNFNLHPTLSPLEVLYPGSLSAGTDDVLTLRDLVVRRDRDHRRLMLASRYDGEALDLVPLNFLYPTAAPQLYRFLCAFAPTRSYRGGLWEQFPQALDGRQLLPRATLGDLVLDRRTWRLPASEVPTGDRMRSMHLDDLRALEGWRRSVGLPRECFFRVVRPVQSGARLDWMEETRRWALEARSARMHKPHYLDFRSPLLLRIFAHRVAEPGEQHLIIQECLPGAADSRRDSADHFAEEFFVEHNLITGQGASA